MTDGEAGASRVALVRCEGYDEQVVYEAIGRGLELLGGVAQFVRPGDKILLKPNLLVGSAPEQAVTTHPAVFGAVARRMREAGAELSYGDSPGFGSPLAAARRSGLVDVAEALGLAPADFNNGTQLSFHAKMPDMDQFSQMLVDLNRFLRPRLYVMDGIVAMEGNGPRSGDPRRLSVLLFSADPVALDATACRLVDLDPALVPTNRWGDEWGLGTIHRIELAGDPLASFRAPDFKVNRRPGSTTGWPGWVGDLLKNLVIPRPMVIPANCTRCGTCVSVCPVDPKAIDFRDGRENPPRHDYGRCIRCYCCQELCPEHAIVIRTPLPGRLLVHR